MSVSSSTDTESNSYSERTLAIIKPEACAYADDIENAILSNGFSILAVSNIYFT